MATQSFALVAGASVQLYGVAVESFICTSSGIITVTGDQTFSRIVTAGNSYAVDVNLRDGDFIGTATGSAAGTFLVSQAGSALGIPVLSKALSGLGYGTPAVTRILRSAQRGLSSISGVASGWTMSAQTTGTYADASSTAVPVTDPRITPIGGPFAAGGTGFRIQGPTTYNGSGIISRNQPHGNGILFAGYFASLVIDANFLGGAWTVYVIDPSTGVRARVQAADFTSTSGRSYWTLTAPAAGFYAIEVYSLGASASFNNIWSLTAGTYISKYTLPDAAKWAWVGDSWGTDAMNGGTNGTKLAPIDYVMAALGCADYLSMSVTGTGAVATNGVLGAANSAPAYADRMNIYSDISVSRIGVVDGVVVPGSLNDFNVAGNTPAVTQAAYLAALQAARAAQPSAVIVGFGPQITPATAVTQPWFDAYAAAFAQWGDKNAVYIDNSPAGENWLNAGTNSVYFTGSVNHLNDVGKVAWGQRAGNSIANAVRGLLGQ